MTISIYKYVKLMEKRLSCLDHVICKHHIIFISDKEDTPFILVRDVLHYDFITTQHSFIRFNNPIVHDEIRTCEPTTLSASEAIVIYRIKRNKQTISNGLNQDHKLDLELGNCFTITFPIDTSY